MPLTLRPNKFRLESGCIKFSYWVLLPDSRLSTFILSFYFFSSFWYCIEFDYLPSSLFARERTLKLALSLFAFDLWNFFDLELFSKWPLFLLLLQCENKQLTYLRLDSYGVFISWLISSLSISISYSWLYPSACLSCQELLLPIPFTPLLSRYQEFVINAIYLGVHSLQGLENITSVLLYPSQKTKWVYS